MTSGGHEFRAKTVEEAIENALAQLGMTADEVDIQVLNKGSRGILGFGSEPALIRVSRKPAPPTPPPAHDATSDDLASAEAVATPPERTSSSPSTTLETVSSPSQGEDRGAVAETETAIDVSATEDVAPFGDDEWAVMAGDMLGRLVELMGFDAAIRASWQEPDEDDGQPYLLLDIQGDDLGALIGRRGETLASLQYLLRLMVNQRVRAWKNIVVDVEHYKQRRVTQLTQLAERMTQQVVDSGRSVTLEPMPANERRIIHLTLRDHPQVFTESIGEGDRRKVSIMPRR